MKSKKSILLTGVLCAAVGLVGCSSNVKDSDKTGIEGANAEVKADTTDTSISNKKDIVKEFDYLNKSGLRFQIYGYNDDISDLNIYYSGSDAFKEYDGYEKYKEEIQIEFPILNRGDDVFKEQLKIATKAVGGTDEEYQKIVDKIAECLTEEYQKTSEVAEKISSTGDIVVDIIKNPKYEIKVALYNVERDNGIMCVSFLSKNKTNYIADSDLSLNDVGHYDKKAKLEINQSIFDDWLGISLSVPVKNVTNSKFKEQVRIAVKSIGGSDTDIEQIYSKLKGSYSGDFDEVIEENDSYSIEMSLEDGFDDEKRIYVQLNAENVGSVWESISIEDSF